MNIARVEGSDESLTRLKTFLNSNQRILAADSGMKIALAGIQGQKQLPEKIQIFPLNATKKQIIYNYRKDKFEEIIIKINTAYLQKLKANTLHVWGENEIPIRKDHFPWGESYGWINPANLEVTESGLFTTVEWDTELETAIKAGRWRYVSAGWALDYEDPFTGKRIGPVLLELSVLNDPYFMSQRSLKMAADGGEMIIVAAIDVQDPALNNKQEDDMDKEKLIKILSLESEANDDAVLAAVEKLQTEKTETDKQVTTMKAEIDQLKAVASDPPEAGKPPAEGTDKAAEKHTPDPSQEGTNKAAGMGDAAAEVMVDAACESGKIPPKAKEKWVKACASLSVAEAKELIGSISSAVPKDAKALKAEAAANSQELDVSKKRLAQAGLSVEDYLKYKHKDEEED